MDPVCLRTISNKILDHNDHLFRRYKDLSLTGPGIRSGNESQILLGYRDEGVILFHGFLASPFEVLELGQHLNKNGYTVYMPLIFGFGSDDVVAGQAQLEDWKLSVSGALQIMRGCFQKIHLIGFSLGAGLTTDYVLRERPTDVASLILLSPYFQPSSRFGKLVNDIVISFTHSIALSKLYTISGHPDLVIPLKFPEYYNSFMPMEAVNTIHLLRDELKTIPFYEASPVHTLLAYSAADATIDYNYAKQFVLSHFSKVRAWIAPKWLNVPHQLTVTSDINDPQKLFEFVEKFLKDNH
jgi:carboxylesterase